MVTDACAEGYSAVIFVNFTDTLKALAETLTHASVVVGGQSSAVRETNVQNFQTNKTNVIICNIAAGGVGVSLHDTEGGHPRMSFISPTFSVKDYVQTLGRIHRAGAKTPVIQRVLIASNTIEEKIIDKLEQKRLHLDTLHQKQK
jgi:SNF2 family DNA or RNA helicase